MTVLRIGITKYALKFKHGACISRSELIYIHTFASIMITVQGIEIAIDSISSASVILPYFIIIYWLIYTCHSCLPCISNCNRLQHLISSMVLQYLVKYANYF